MLRGIKWERKTFLCLIFNQLAPHLQLANYIIQFWLDDFDIFDSVSTLLQVCESISALRIYMGPSGPSVIILFLQALTSLASLENHVTEIMCYLI